MCQKTKMKETEILMKIMMKIKMKIQEIINQPIELIKIVRNQK